MRWRRAIVIAIDGPAGSGKSTAAKKVAESLGIAYLDSGALYRAYTLEFLNRKVDLEKDDIANILDEIVVQLQDAPTGRMVLLNGEDVTQAIRDKSVTAWVSAVAENPIVREKVNEIQRKTAGERSVVVDGRDIGTAVFPDARLKIYLDASLEERAKRRYLEQCSCGDHADLDMIKQDIRRRDKQDSERKIAPLVKAEDAIVLDTTDLGIDEVAGIIVGHARALNFEP